MNRAYTCFCIYRKMCLYSILKYKFPKANTQSQWLRDGFSCNKKCFQNCSFKWFKQCLPRNWQTGSMLLWKTGLRGQEKSWRHRWWRSSLLGREAVVPQWDPQGRHTTLFLLQRTKPEWMLRRKAQIGYKNTLSYDLNQCKNLNLEFRLKQIRCLKIFHKKAAR